MASTGRQRGQGGGEESETSEGEDEESSSSSHLIEKGEVGEKTADSEVLSQFRLQWKQELQSKKGFSADNGQIRNNVSRTTSPSGQSSYATVTARSLKDHDVAFEKARDLFLEGVEHEQQGCMYEAIRSYRQALQLVPDIERKLYNASQSGKQAVDTRLSASPRLSSCPHGNSAGVSSEVGDEHATLSAAFAIRLSPPGAESRYCWPERTQDSVHMSALPFDVLFHIFRWVISAELDLRMLEQLALVCSGFYIIARNPELWRLACLRVWGIRTGGPMLDIYPSWRDMYIERPHVLYHGIYIAKVTYVRHGESSFQDHQYRPWHLVVYYRFLRLFADGTALMLTTPDDPVSALPLLRSRTPRTSTVLVGNYRLLNSGCVIAELKRPKTGVSEAPPVPYRRTRSSTTNALYEYEQSYKLELRITSLKVRKHVQLEWVHYEITTNYKNGAQTISSFDLNDQTFPALHFSRVRSFAAQSDEPL